MVEQKSNLLRQYVLSRKTARELGYLERLAGSHTKISTTSGELHISRSNLKIWDSYNSSIQEYENDFILLGDRVIHTFLEKRMASGQQSYVIDLASGGRAMRDLAQEDLITAGLSVGLSDLRSSPIKNYDDSLNIEVLSEDLLKGKTWLQIKNWLKNQKTDGADLIMCCPGIGFDKYPIPLMPIFAQKALQLLQPGGMAVAEIPSVIPREQFHRWSEKIINERRDLQVIYHSLGQQNFLKVIKKS